MNIPTNTFDTAYGQAVAPQASEGRVRRNNYAPASRNSREQLPESEFWLNVGLYANGTVNDEDAPRFISLPMGLPLDNMKPAKVTGDNEVFRQQQAAKNDLWSQLMQLLSSIEPGQEIEIPLVVRGRRAKPKTEVNTSGSPFAIKLALPVATQAAIGANAQVVSQAPQAAPAAPVAPVIIASPSQPVYPTDAFEDEEEFEMS